MARNVEIKARLDSIEAITDRIAALDARGPTEIVQDDTFFTCARGRLKLRTFSPDAGELIFYRRADEAGPKESFFTIAPTTAPDALREALALAYGQAGRVRKHRTLYLVGRTRIHLDRVEGLGHFLELEVVLAEDEPSEAGMREARDLMAALGVTADQLVEGAYVDLLARSSPPGETDAARERYAEELRYAGHLRSRAVVRAFARVPRERYLGAGPWRIYQPYSRQYWTTPDADPRHVYHDVLVALDETRLLNNGQPSFLAFLIEALALREGEHVVHVGCGTGYYSAILAELVGPGGRVTAIEADAELAARSRANLADRANVQVVHGDGSAHDPGPADAILVNAGATHPHRVWLDALQRGGRLLVPLTGLNAAGWVLRVIRGDGGYAAQFISSISIFPCAGAREPETARRLGDTFASGGWATVRSLRRDTHEPDASCWLHGEHACLSTLDVRS